MIVYDVEVLRGPQDTEDGWKNPAGMGFGTAVAYDEASDLFYFYGPDHKELLIDRFTKNKILVCSFNGIQFDNKVVLGNDYTPAIKWLDCDLLIEVIRGKFDCDCETMDEAHDAVGWKTVHDGSISLDGLAYGTLRKGKTGSGAHAPQLIQESKWAEVYAYNLHDVRLTLMLLQFARKYGYLIDKKNNIIPMNKERLQG